MAREQRRTPDANRRFTQANVIKILGAWPQAISADDGDLRVLHDMANAGAQSWGESLRWPDYLWLGLDHPVPSAKDRPSETFDVRVAAPPGHGPDANLGVVHRTPIRPASPGLCALSGKIECFLELKAITGDHLAKFRSFNASTQWQAFVEAKLRNAFSSLQRADEQIRDGRRIIGSACGVSIIVNEGSHALPSGMAYAALGKALKRLSHTDAIVYLSDGSRRPDFAIVRKNEHDERVGRFMDEFSMMFNSVTWTADGPTLRGGPYPKLAIRIEMDERSRAMYRTWSTGWRRSDDPTPIPSPTLKMAIVRSDEFRSGPA